MSAIDKQSIQIKLIKIPSYQTKMVSRSFRLKHCLDYISAHGNTIRVIRTYLTSKYESTAKCIPASIKSFPVLIYTYARVYTLLLAGFRKWFLLLFIATFVVRSFLLFCTYLCMLLTHLAGIRVLWHIPQRIFGKPELSTGPV